MFRKDSLYCDAPSSPKRRAYRTVLDVLFHALVRWVSPILCFTAEEIWQTRYPDPDKSVHMLEWPKIDTAWSNDGLGEKWQWLRQCRSVVTGAIEPLRSEKIIGSSLQAKVKIGRAHVRTPVTNAHLVSLLPLDNKNNRTAMIQQ